MEGGWRGLRLVFGRSGWDVRERTLGFYGKRVMRMSTLNSVSTWLLYCFVA